MDSRIRSEATTYGDFRQQFAFFAGTNFCKARSVTGLFGCSMVLASISSCRIPYLSKLPSVAVAHAVATILVTFWSTALFASNPSTVLAPNSFTVGEWGKLLQLGRLAPEISCDSPTCIIPIRPVRLGVSGSGPISARVVFSTAAFPRNLLRFADGVAVQDQATRPVLLQGYARIRHAGEHGEVVQVPVAGTLFRDSSGHYVSVSLRRMRRGNRSGSQSLVHVRIPMVPGRVGGKIHSRAAQASSFAFGNMSCGQRVSSLKSVSPSNSPAQSPVSTAPVTTTNSNAVFVATDFDSQFASSLGCTVSSCNNRILSFVNAASTIYRQQLNLVLSVAAQYGPTASLGGTTNSETLLENFRLLNNSARSGARVDLYQLFTGRDLNQNVVGLAFVGVTCRQKSFAAMLVQNVSDTLNPITLAHETGHTLNADHPATAEGGIMDATARSPFPTTFSTRSLGQMVPYLTANYSRCIGGTAANPTPTPTIEPTSTPVSTATPTPGPGTPTATPGPGGTQTPGPTPTRTPGSGAGNGGGVGGGKPRTIALTASLSNTGAFSAQATTTAVDGCTLTISAGSSEVTADPGTTVYEAVPAGIFSKLKAVIPFRVKASRKGPEVVLFARRTCSGEVVEVSRFVGIRPSRVASRLPENQRKAFRVLSRRSWIAELQGRISLVP
jgi:hypothetical protein